jgi:serine/threonine-protein kinase
MDWKKVEDLFNQAVELPADEQAEFLRRACGTDGALREEVESLIRFSSQGEGFIEEPALETEARRLAGELGEHLEGESVGPFLVLDFLTSGGMASVYKARDERDGRIVALKLLNALPGDPDDSKRVRRMLREGKAAGKLKHPNIARVLEVGRDADRAYIAMELVGGRTLDLERAEREFGDDEILGIASQAASALNKAHRHGVVHRDIKPGNLMLTPEGQIKVLDFGLVKSAAADGSGDLSLSVESLTLTGTLVGTVDFMSPEQALGGKLDGRSDIYSLGAVLYELVTGCPPHQGGVLGVKIGRILREPPVPVRHFRPDISPKLEALINKCLEKDPAARYQSGLEIVNEAAGVGDAGEPWLTRVRVPVLFTLLVLSFLLLLWYFRSP